MAGMTTNQALHSLGVAKECERLANVAGWESDPQRAAYLMGWLHDCGKNWEPGFEGHGEWLADDLVRILGVSGPYSDCLMYAIRRHGLGADEDASRSRRPDDASVWLDILGAADMTVDSTGRNVTFEERLDDVASRYGADSEVYRSCSRRIACLRDNGFGTVGAS